MLPGITYREGGYNPALPGDNKLQEIVDNGDGTGTLITYDEAGAPTSSPCELDAPPPLTNAERFAALPPEQATAILDLSTGLIDRAGDLWDALVDIAPGNTAKPFADIVTHEVLTAALVVTEGPSTRNSVPAAKPPVPK